MGKLAFVDRALDELKSKGLYNTIRTIEGPMGAWVQIDGKKRLNLCANNYLALRTMSDCVRQRRRRSSSSAWGREPSDRLRAP